MKDLEWVLSSYSSVGDDVYQDWADAMRGYTSGTSPTAGDTFDAPLNTYDPAGSEGSGFYHKTPNGMEKLNID